MKGSFMESLQRLGKALMGAVAVMPVAAILMGIGYWLDPTGWGANNVAAAILIKAGGAVLDNLGWIFAIAISFGLAKDSNGAAALSGFLGYGTIKLLLAEGTVAGYQGVDLAKLKEEGGQALLDWNSHGWAAINDKNVLIGILVGILAAWVYNRFHRAKLPDFLAFFSGRRLVPILTSIFAIALAGILYLVWPIVYGVLFSFGQWLYGLGAIGAGLYGVANRLLIPTGLHHALNQIFWFDVIGIDDIGKFLKGGETIEAAKAATDAATCPGVWTDGVCTVIGEVGRYQGGFFPVMMFGLPAAALAIYLRADKSKKKAIGSLMAAGALASIFTGVTEPLEFSFMFVAPLLYGVHAILTGLAVFIAATFKWTAGFGFSAGFVDMLLSSQNPIANQWYMLLLQGIVFAVIYFVIFYFLIGALNLKTPGRGDDDDANAQLKSDAPLSDVATKIIAGLGGIENVDTLDYCATRLRTIVKDYTKVNENTIKEAGVAGVIRPSQKAVQVVIGPKVQFVYDEVADQLRASDAQLNGEQAF
ncbi:N-acetylglucosamine-specific PTS transporter subunit IIBC [Arcanobacterium hippocoleae]|uniref:N-acetylglucosamine-specific PTS transporter subunit IIBC n=1 Tax=Arcanobacterium hippocoleae TaxID=149017 RepID=UPI00334289BE